MVQFLILTVAVLCGFWPRCLSCFIDSRHTCKEENGISTLPDDILIGILSHLTLRDAVKMSILSTRWRNMWLALPNLDLQWHVLSGNGSFIDKDCELHKEAYVRKVNQVLRQYEEQQISSFRISFCFTKEYASYVDHWMSFASKKSLESLTLEFICTDHPYCLRHLNPVHKPGNMYCITSSFLSQFPCLKGLRLDYCILKLHSDFRFNELVKLDLTGVVLEGALVQLMLTISSTIEWLRFKKCHLPGKLCIGDNLQRLSALMFDHCSDLLEIELNANNLRTFEFSGKTAVKCSFLSAPKLEKSYVYVSHFYDYRGVNRLLTDIATSFPTLRTLFLNGNFPLVYELPTHPSNLFRHVEWLSLVFFSDAPEISTREGLPRLLRSFPLLQKLHLGVPYTQFSIRGEIPAVLHSSLKEVKLIHFQVAWMKCARFLLKSSTVLDRMVINRHSEYYIGGGDWKKLGMNFTFSKKERKYIRSELQGSAISPNAKVIII